jgi:hypothetical protein
MIHYLIRELVRGAALAFLAAATLLFIAAGDISFIYMGF